MKLRHGHAPLDIRQDLCHRRCRPNLWTGPAGGERSRRPTRFESWARSTALAQVARAPSFGGRGCIRRFKTLKYQPQFPKRFGCIQDAKTFCRAFFDWYNQDHHHLGIGLMTPNQVHYGQADEVHVTRQKTLDQAFNVNPTASSTRSRGHLKNPPPSGSIHQPRSYRPKPNLEDRLSHCR